ncbi:MAG: TRAP transporter small permease subunit [Rhodobacteraceae bacterium]|nr:TRAP transporter small permease subunit [Paracoccaceae bacterium]
MTQFVGLEAGQKPKGHLAGCRHARRPDALDAAVLAIGKVFALCWLLLVLLVILSVAERYAPPITRAAAMIFGSNPGTALGELQWHVFAAGFMVGLSYAMVRGSHVRVDVLAEHWNLKVRAWIEMLGTVLFLLPFALLIIIYGVPFVERSMALNEISSSPGGLGGRWIIKSFIVIGPALLLVAGVARILRVGNFLFRRTPY